MSDYSMKPGQPGLMRRSFANNLNPVEPSPNRGLSSALPQAMSPMSPMGNHRQRGPSVLNEQHYVQLTGKPHRPFPLGKKCLIWTLIIFWIFVVLNIIVLDGLSNKVKVASQKQNVIAASNDDGSSSSGTVTISGSSTATHIGTTSASIVVPIVIPSSTTSNPTSQVTAINSISISSSSSTSQTTSQATISTSVSLSNPATSEKAQTPSSSSCDIDSTITIQSTTTVVGPSPSGAAATDTGVLTVTAYVTITGSIPDDPCDFSNLAKRGKRWKYTRDSIADKK